MVPGTWEILCKGWLLPLSLCHFPPRLTSRAVVIDSVLPGSAGPSSQVRPLLSPGMWSAGVCTSHRSPSRRPSSAHHGQPISGEVSRTSLVTHGYLALGTRPCQPVFWVASHKDKPQRVPVAPCLVLASFSWGAGAELCQSQTPLPLHAQLWPVASVCPKGPESTPLHSSSKGQVVLGGRNIKLMSRPGSYPTPAQRGPYLPFPRSLLPQPREQAKRYEPLNQQMRVHVQSPLPRVNTGL